MRRSFVFLFAFLCMQQLIASQEIAQQIDPELIVEPAPDIAIQEPIIIDEPIFFPGFPKPFPVSTRAPRPPQDGYFTIVGSNGIHPNSVYNVAVTSHSYNKKITVLVGIRSDNTTSTPSFDVQQNVTVNKRSTKTISFTIGSIPAGSYQLYSRNIENADAFDEQTNLQYLAKQYSVYIQTDKAEYLPGDLIQFRILVLGPDLKPFYPADPIQININDAATNLIKQFTNVTLIKGVYHDELQLTKYPPTGDWTITFLSGGVKETKTISVNRYVLPKYEVTVTTVRHATFADGKISATIDAKYTYGQNVKGALTVNAYRAYYTGSTIKNYPPLLSRTYNDFNGQKLVELTYNDLFTVSSAYEQDIIIEAILVEGLTGNNQTGEGTVTIHQYPYQLSVTGESSYNPNLTYTATVKVSYWDGSPVRDTINPVQVTVQNLQMWWIWPQPETYSQQYNLTLDNNGLATLSFIPPANYTQYQISAIYKEVSYYYLSITKTSSDADEYIKLSIITENPTVNKQLELKVQGTADFDIITYFVIAHGNVVRAATITSSDHNVALITFRASFAMLTYSKLFAYYVTDTGKFVFDSIDIKLAPTFPNAIVVGVSKSTVKPGDDITITVHTKPHSYCGLLALDASVLLQAKGNDLDRNTILNGLDAYNSAQQYNYPYPAFDEVATVVITNVEPSEVIYSGPIWNLEYNMAMDIGGPIMMEDVAVADGAVQPSPAQPRVRKEFPAIFLWEDIEDVINDQNKGVAKLQRKAPDTITKWVITAFTIDNTTGFGLIDTPKTFNTFMPFFIRLELPFSVIRGETVLLKITVFNYQSLDITAIVTFSNSNGDFTWEEGNDATHQNNDASRSKQVQVPANDGAQVTFLISPHTIGPIPIKVTALSNRASDAIEQPLLVEAEGSTKYTNRGYLIDLRTNPSFSANVESGFPAVYVPDSQLITVSCIGDALGTTIKNLDNLIQMPYGCGEQNLITVFPNIVAVIYLTAVGQLTNDIQVKAFSYIEAGYQRQLSYIHPDGTFSAFGPTGGPIGSTWLTAFSMKAFIESTPYISVDQNVINRGMSALISRQQPDGSFAELGNVIHKDMQGGGSNGLGLTSYVLTILLLSPVYAAQYSAQIDLTINYIISIISTNSDIDIYPLAVTAYALQLANHAQKDAVLDQLVLRATTTSDGLYYWEKILPADNSYWYTAVPNSVSVEITSYAILALTQAGRIVYALPALRWLISKQNPTGGFCSTQDTVMGIEAISKMAATMFAGNPSIDIDIIANSLTTTNFHIDRNNAYVLQQVEVASDTTSLQIQANGNGIALCTVSYKYNVEEESVFPRFNLGVVVDDSSTSELLTLNIDLSYIVEPNDLESNMALLSITLPSGFGADTVYLDGLVETKIIQRWETRNQDTIIDIYINNVDAAGVSFSVQAKQNCEVANSKPVPVRVVDYYNNAKNAEVFYQPKQSTRCDICRGDNICLDCVHPIILE